MINQRIALVLAFLFPAALCVSQTSGPVSTQQLNYWYLTAGPTPTNLIHVGGTDQTSTLAAACSANAGYGQVIIQQGANPSDAPTIGGESSYSITGGCANVTIQDLRGTAGASCYVYSDSATYVQAPCTSGGSSSAAFSGITSGTNTTAVMVVGTGASIEPSGTGVITPSNTPYAELNSAITFGTSLAYSTSLGQGALSSGGGDGIGNTAFGSLALRFATYASGNNTAVGQSAGGYITTGSFNTFIGARTGETLLDGNSNFLGGYNADVSGASDTNEIVIGSTAIGNGSNTATFGNSSVTHAYVGTNALCQSGGTDCPAISGTAGGDLSGSYPNPTVSQINGTAVPTDQTLTVSTSGGRLASSGIAPASVLTLGGAVTSSNFSINQTCAGGTGTGVTPAAITGVAGTDTNHTLKLTLGSGTVAPSGNCVLFTMTYTNAKSHVSYPIESNGINISDQQAGIACQFTGDCTATAYNYRALAAITSSTEIYLQVFAP